MLDPTAHPCVGRADPRRSRRSRALLVIPGAMWLIAFGVAPLVILFLMSFWTSSIFGRRRT